jgi:hypothetical protein
MLRSGESLYNGDIDVEFTPDQRAFVQRPSRADGSAARKRPFRRLWLWEKSERRRLRSSR